MERRKLLRLLSKWRDWCGDDQYPSFASVDPTQIAEIWDYCFVLDIVGHEDNPVVRTAGAELQNYLPESARDITLSYVPASSLIEHAASHYQEVLARRADFARWRVCKI